jgi:hypothetical protein
MALRRLLDQDAQRERRNQQLLLERLSRVAERLLSKEITGTTLAMVKRWEASGQVTSPDEHIRRIESLLRRIWRASVEGMAKRISAAAKSASEPDVIKEQAKWDLFVQEYIADFGGEKIQQITTTTREQIMAQIAIGQAEGLGQREIAKIISNNAPTIGRQRGALIARTETHGAGNYGAKKQAESTGLNMRREWIAASGERTRSSHNAADGQTVGMDEPFTVGGESLDYPGDPSGSADNVINCRCAVGYIVID